jgi:hypothetical protein
VTTGRDLVGVGGDVVGRGDVGSVEVLGCPGTVLEVALTPGCSLDTTTPRAMVAPIAPRAAARVRRRRSASARPLDSGELNGGAELTCLVLGRASGHSARASS